MEACSNSVKVLVDLDALLDTRLGAVSRLSSTAAVRLVKGDWINRDNDFWQRTSPEFTYEQFRELYFRREKETLMASGPTSMGLLLEDIAKDIQLDPGSPERVKVCELVVNLDRYQLDAFETEELEALLLEIMPFVSKVQFIRTCIKRLTVANIRQLGATFYICYDLFTWIRANNDEIILTTHLWLTVLAPAIKEHNPEDFDDAEEIKALSQGMNPFTAFELLLGVNLNLRFCETKYFSLTTDIKGGA